MTRIELQPAFVLHRWPYRNTSLIVELFTANHGRFSVVARSARGPNSRFKGILMPFAPLLVGWSGKHELKILNHAELTGPPCSLDHQALLCGLYLNELIIRLLEREDSYPHLFVHYQNTLEALLDNIHTEAVLRRFEKQLLDELGYGIPLYFDAESKKPIEVHAYYRYHYDHGFVHCEAAKNDPAVFSGNCLHALREERFESIHLKEMKCLMRLALSRHLGKRPLKSRELLI